MKSHMFRAGRAITAVLVAASLATPITVWADDGGGRDNRARAQSQPRSQAQSRQAQQAKDRERSEQTKRAQDAQRAKQEQERQERRNNRVLGALDETRDTKPSDHPSGKDRNDERGASSPQGASRSNPDGGGIDKPFAVGSLVAGSQGRGDFDGNNGCGNDNDFADDNNGN